MKTHLHGLLALYLAVFLLSLNGLFAKLIPLNALTITQLRSVVAIIGFLLVFLMRKRSLRLQGLRQQGGVMALGVLLGLHWVTFFHAMQVSTVAVGMLSLFSFPIMTILLEPFFAGERVRRSDLLAGFLVLCGIAIMVSRDLDNISGSIVQGVFWGVTSALLFSMRNLLQKYRFSAVPSDSLMFHQVVAIAIMLLPFIDVEGVGSLTPVDWGTVVLLGLLSTATGHTMLSYSLKQLAAKTVALIGCMQPLVAALLAWLVLREVPQLSVAIGGGLILAVAMYESTARR